jgi:hypothetical protein
VANNVLLLETVFCMRQPCSAVDNLVLLVAALNHVLLVVTMSAGSNSVLQVETMFCW